MTTLFIFLLFLSLFVFRRTAEAEDLEFLYAAGIDRSSGIFRISITMRNTGDCPVTVTRAEDFCITTAGGSPSALVLTRDDLSRAVPFHLPPGAVRGGLVIEGRAGAVFADPVPLNPNAAPFDPASEAGAFSGPAAGAPAFAVRLTLKGRGLKDTDWYRGEMG